MAPVGIWGPLGWGGVSTEKIRAAFRATNDYAPARARSKHLDLHEGVVEARAAAAHIIMNSHFIFKHVITPEDVLLGDDPNNPVTIDPDQVGRPIYASRIVFPDQLPASLDKGPFAMRFGETGVGLGLVAVLSQIEVVGTVLPESEMSAAPISPIPNSHLINTTV